MKGSVTRSTETVTERETIQGFATELRKIEFGMQELCKIDIPEWDNMLQTIRYMREKGLVVADMKPMSRAETLIACDMKAAPYRPN